MSTHVRAGADSLNRSQFQLGRSGVAGPTHYVAGSSHANSGRGGPTDPLLSKSRIQGNYVLQPPIVLVAPSGTASVSMPHVVATPVPTSNPTPVPASRSLSANDCSSLCKVISLITTIAALLFILIGFVTYSPGLLMVGIFSLAVALPTAILSCAMDSARV